MGWDCIGASGPWAASATRCVPRRAPCPASARPVPVSLRRVRISVGCESACAAGAARLGRTAPAAGSIHARRRPFALRALRALARA
eukprot:3421181-Pleurochrysis_carterae.AAC.1